MITQSLAHYLHRMLASLKVRLREGSFWREMSLCITLSSRTDLGRTSDICPTEACPLSWLSKKKWSASWLTNWSNVNSSKCRKQCLCIVSTELESYLTSRFATKTCYSPWWLWCAKTRLSLLKFWSKCSASCTKLCRVKSHASSWETAFIACSANLLDLTTVLSTVCKGLVLSCSNSMASQSMPI